MTHGTDQLAAFNKAQMEAALKMAETAAEHMEKLAEVQLSAAKAVYANSLNTLRQLAAVKDLGELSNLSKGMAQPAWEEATSYAKKFYNTVAAAQSQFAGTLERQVAELNKKMLSSLDTAMKAAPPGSEAAFAAAKSAVESTNSVYETMVKAAKQMASLAEANIAAASQTKPTKR